MGTLTIVGTQWGDEGKGKITNLLSKKADYVVRYQGGDNAGHTVYIDDEKYVFHLLPSGIIEKDKICVLGNGVVINPESLFKEIQVLKDRGIGIHNRILVSDKAHLVFPYHKYIDKQREISKGSIGTTKKGIGPAYSDKYARIGIRAGDYINDKIFLELLTYNIEEKKSIIKKFDDPDNVKRNIIALRNKILKEFKKFVNDTTFILNQAIDQKKKILFEGAQGILLDIDFGTYPFVTSSNPSAGGVATGTGVPPNKINNVLGITKAYTTRVGNGPFPVELKDGIGDHLRNRGKEYGATTGRPRRCGWLDMVVVKHSIMINGIRSIALTKLDILDEMEEIKVCVAYTYKGKKITTFPHDREIQCNVKPVYKTLKGWKQNTENIKQYKDLPGIAKKYIEFIEKEAGCPVSIISIGADRASTIIKEPQFIHF
ncbi:MAG: adenylosuccinate synthase [Spirochaetes bacterium]|nr:adenylosuccinate synthase [Spirochaetota bacterium]